MKLKTTPAKKVAAKKAAPVKKMAAKKIAPRRVEEDDVEPPRSRKKVAGKKVAASAKVGVATTGWGGADEIGGSGDFIKNLDFKNDAAKSGGTLWFLLRFMEDGPYANVRIHWLEKKGKRSYVCIGEDCPLCAMGDDPKAERRFNVAVFTDSDPVVRSWNTGFKIYTKIKSLAEQPLTKPLPKKLYLATRTGKQWNEIEYDLDKITAAEIAEGYPDIYVPSAAEIEELTPYTLDDVEAEYSTLEELEEVAAAMLEGEDDDE